MNKKIVYALAALTAILFLGLVYVLWPWSGAVLALIAVGGLSYWLYKAGWKRTAQWNAIFGVALVFVLLGWYFRPLWEPGSPAPQEAEVSQSSTPVAGPLWMTEIVITSEWSDYYPIPRGERLKPRRADPTTAFEVDFPTLEEPIYVPASKAGTKDDWELKTPDSDRVRFRLADPEKNRGKKPKLILKFFP